MRPARIAKVSNTLEARKSTSKPSSFLWLGLCLIAACAFAGTPCSAQEVSPLFSSPVIYGSGGYGSQSVAVADLNGDGKPDLVVGNFCATSSCTNGGVSVLLGKGGGTFQTSVSYNTGGIPFQGGTISVAIADVNGDRDLDIIVSNPDGEPNGDGSVGVLLGNGDGTFRPVVTYDSHGSLSSSVTAADVNADGIPDIVVANQGMFSTSCTAPNCPGSVSVLLGNGDGTFKAAVSYPSGGNYALSIAVGDVNKDGHEDLLVGNWFASNGSANGSVSVLLGNGDGTFQTAVTYGTDGTRVLSIVASDVNGDGLPDLLVANEYGSIDVLLGNGDGTFRTAVAYSSNPNGGAVMSLAIGDVDGDGKLDLAVANWCSDLTCSQIRGSVSVLLGNGDGTFRAATTYDSGGVGTSSVSLADVNGDGRPDLLVANECSIGSNPTDCSTGSLPGVVGVFLNDATATPPAARAWLGASAIGNVLFTTAGGTDAGADFGGNEVSVAQAYDVIENSWSQKASLQNARFGLTASVVNGRIYAIGGTSGPSSLPLGSVDQYDPASNSWSSKTPMPTPRWKLTSSVVNGFVYAIGGGPTGNQCGTTGAVETYDPATDSWIEKTAMPTPRWGASSATISNLVYVVGGSLSCPQALVAPSSALEVYDAAIDTWAAKPSMSTARWDLAVAAANGKLYAIGGWDPLNQKVLATVEEFDPATNSWTTKSPMPTARSGLIAVTINGKVYAFGGSDNTKVLAVLEVFDPVTNTWASVSEGGPPSGTHTLTVASTNPGSGVPITVSLLDNRNLSDGVTQFTRTYNTGIQITLGASSVAAGNNFSTWGGCDSTVASTCTVTIDSDRTVTANFVTPVPSNPPPTITSTSPSQAIQGGKLTLFLIEGANFQTGAVISFTGGQDIAITRMSTSPTRIVLNLAISPTSAAGTHAVTVTNPDGQSATLGAALTVLAVPATPQGLYAVVGNQTVYLWWMGTQAIPQGYNVYIDGAKANLSGLIQGTFFAVNSLQNGHRYQLSVTAVGGGGESNPAAVSAMPNAFGAQAHPPHPVLFLHGINANATAWETTADFLTGTLGWTCGGTFAYTSAEDPNKKLPHGVTLSEGSPSPCLSVANLSADYFTADFGNNLANYPDSRGIFHQGDEVGGFLRALQGHGPLSIVAWSMGGLAARSYMQVTDPIDARNQISDLITLGTPHWGVNGSDPFIIDGFALFVGFDPATSRGFFDMNGGCASNGDYGATQQLSQFLQSLDVQPTFPLPGNTRYVVVSGTGGFIPYLDVACSQPLHRLPWDIAVTTTSSSLTGILPAQDWSSLTTPDIHTQGLGGTALPDDFTTILCAIDNNCLQFQVLSPVDIQVTAPNGFTISNKLTSMPGADYTTVVDADGHETATILIPFPQGGPYTIGVTPKPGAQPTDTYTITMTQGGGTTTIADHVKVQNIPSGGYHAHVNSRPFANAGADQTVECRGHRGTRVTLNGLASRDQDGDSLMYVWTDSQGNKVGNRPIVTVLASMGKETYMLTVTDPAGLNATSQTHVTVRDTKPPSISISPSQITVVVNSVPVLRTVLGLPVPVVSDACDPNPRVTDDGPASFSAGSNVIAFKATDASGNTSQVKLTVHVELRFTIQNAAVVVTQFHHPDNDIFGAEITVKFGTGSDGINRLTDALHFKATGGAVSVAFDLPLSRFRSLGGNLVFSGRVNALPTDISLTRLGRGKYICVIAITRAKLTGFHNPVTITLGFGSDIGQITVDSLVLKE